MNGIILSRQYAVITYENFIFTMQATSDNPDVQARPPSSTVHQLWRYLAPILLAPACMIASAFWILPTRWFEDRSNNIYLANFGYGATLHGRQCDILVYGDSSALVAVDPATLTARTGLSACNIAEVEGITLVNGTQPVDDFLARNPAPRFLVFAFAPEDFQLDSAGLERVGSFPAIDWQIKYGRGLTRINTLLHHLPAVFAWSELGLRMAAQRLHAQPFAPSSRAIRANNNGRLPIGPNFGAVDDASSCPTGPALAPDADWVASLRRRYAVGMTQVIVDAFPVASCDNTLPFYQTHVAPLVDNRPYAPIDISDFNSYGRLHVNARGSEKVSAMIADQILKRQVLDRQGAR